jgi:hypothetical protein
VSEQDVGPGLFDGQFVYVPPPTPFLVTDPKYHQVGFQFQEAEQAKTQLAASTSTATPFPPPATPTPHPTATPAITPNLFAPLVTPAATTAPTSWPTAWPATPVIRAVIVEKAPLFHETNFHFDLPAATSTSTPIPSKPAQPVATSASWIPATQAPSTVASPTNTPAPPTPLPPTATPQIIVHTPQPYELDIEDPRFYRGSFTFAPTGSAQAGAATNSVVNAPFYSGTSVDTLSPTYSESSPLPVAGKAMYYNPGIMQEVYAYRLRLGQVQPCSECVGYVALLRKGDLGRKVWLRWGDGTVEGPFLVIDVAARQHVGLLLTRGWAVDVDYATAIRRGMNRPVPVTILATP